VAIADPGVGADGALPKRTPMGGRHSPSLAPQLPSLVPHVDANTVWNEVPDDAAGFELALRARIVWLSGRMDSWCNLDHAHCAPQAVSNLR
jgi:hypothetical protein